MRWRGRGRSSPKAGGTPNTLKFAQSVVAVIRCFGVVWGLPLMAAALTGCTTPMRYAPARTELGTETVVLPARECGGFFFVEADVGDGRTHSFALDTGAGLCVVTPEFEAAHRAWARSISGTVRGAEGDEMEVRRAVRIPVLRLGEATFRDVDAVVIDLEHLSEAVGVRFDGIIGYPLFRDLVLTLDYQGGEVRVWRGRLEQDERTVRIGRERPIMMARVNGEERLLLIDSGSNDCVALFAKLDSLPLAGQAGVTTPMVTISGLHDGESAGRLDGDMEFGGVVVRQPIIVETDGMSRVGTRLLEHFAVSLDQRTGRARFDREGSGEIVVEPIRSTGARLRREVDGWVVWWVAAGSPAAAADLRPGDVVVSVEGRDPGELVCGGLRDLMRERDELMLVTRRGGEEREIRVGVVDMVP